MPEHPVTECIPEGAFPPGDGMRWVPGGTFRMGDDNAYPEEAPAHKVAVSGFWWFTMWFLLAGRVSWRRLYPCAVTTGAFWMGMLAVFAAILSGMVISYDQKYGPIGVVFGLMSFFIAVGVVIILGAAVGLMWQDRGLSFRAAVRKLRRAS